jgi:hypothetical protein
MRTAWSPAPVPVSHPSCQTTRIGHHGTLTGPWPPEYVVNPARARDCQLSGSAHVTVVVRDVAAAESPGVQARLVLGNNLSRRQAPAGRAAARGDDLVVVGELREVERPASGMAGLRLGCPPVPVVVRAARMLRSPSAAQRALAAESALHHATSGVRPGLGDPDLAAKPTEGARQWYARHHLEEADDGLRGLSGLAGEEKGASWDL